MTKSIYLYREFSGNFSSWKRAAIVSNDGKRLKFAAGEIVILQSGQEEPKSLTLSYLDSKKQLVPSEEIEQYVLCRFLKKGVESNLRIQISIVDQIEFKSRILGFDRSPYFGGKYVGFATAALSSLFMIGIGVSTIIASIWKSIAVASSSTAWFLIAVAPFVALTTIFIGACGIRGGFYYLKFPKSFKN